MLRKEYIIQTFTVMRANKLRASLSMLGIIIGVFVVVVLLAIGEGTKTDISKNFESMGANLITLRGGGSSNVRFQPAQNSDSLDEYLVEFLKKIDGIQTISPTTTTSKQLIYNTNNTRWNIIWVLPTYQQMKNLTVSDWFFFNEDDVRENTMVAVIGKTIYDTLFSGEDAIGKDIKAENKIITVLGVFADNSAVNNAIVIPLTTAQNKIIGTSTYSSIDMTVQDTDTMDTMKKIIEDSLVSYFHVATIEEAPVQISNIAEILSSIQSVMAMMTAFLASIAAISLLVGWIGVMNIMLVSVTERTKEIGIRKAIGAMYKDILLQFLTESVFISVFAWLIGVGLSFGTVYIINKFITATITVNSVVIAFFSAVSIWIIFGILPASKAAKLKPIDALRYE